MLKYRRIILAKYIAGDRSNCLGAFHFVYPNVLINLVEIACWYMHCVFILFILGNFQNHLQFYLIFGEINSNFCAYKKQLS